jgi:hypothetical protein
MAVEHEDHGNSEQQGEPEQDPNGRMDEVWRAARTCIELGGLYFEYKQNEGAALAAQALVLIVQMIIDSFSERR